MKVDFARWLLLATAIPVAACSPYSKTIAMNAQGIDLRKEVVVGVSLPPMCPMIPGFVPSEKAKFNISYNEPTVNVDGSPLDDLAYTTVYVITPDTKTTAIRVWANNPSGGTRVTVRDIPVRSPNTRICITATDTHRNESLK